MNSPESLTAEARQDLDELIASLAEQELSPALFDRLQAIVTSDPAARRYYVQQINLRAGLFCRVNFGTLSAASIQDETAGEAVRETIGTESIVSRGIDAPAGNLSETSNDHVSGGAAQGRKWLPAPVLPVEELDDSQDGIHLPAETHPVFSTWSWGRFSVLGGAAFLVLVACYFQFSGSRPHEALPNSRVVQGAADQQLVGLVPGDALPSAASFDEASGLMLPEYFAIVTNLSSGAETSPALNIGAGLRISSLVVNQGVVELLFWDGATVVLKGPAKFVIHDRDLAELHYGKLQADVPDTAIGFTIKTPNLRVIDLGTKFGVDVSEGGAEEVHVFRGAVLTRFETATGESAGAFRLTECNAVTYQPKGQRFLSGLADQSRFIEPDLPDQPAPPLNIPQAYVNAVLASGPIAYWRFESVHDSLVESEIPTSPALRLLGNVRISNLSNENGNSTAIFARSGGERGLVPATPFPSSTLSQYTVEMFFCAAWHQYGALFQVHAFKDGDDMADPLKTAIFLQLHESANDLVPQPKSLRFVDRQPPAGRGGCTAWGPYRATTHWHHLIAVRDEQTIAFYLDGQCIQRTEHGLPPRDKSMAYTMQIGRHSGHNPADYRFFYGDLDEVAWYNRALSEDEIAEHYRAFAE